MKKFKNKILFVDEHRLEVEPIMDVLTEKYGLDALVHIQSSNLALEFIKENHEQIIAISLDILMPYEILKNDKLKKQFELEGLAVLDYLYENHKSIPVICYSWVNEPEIIAEIEGKGACYLYKPDGESYIEFIDLLSDYYEKNLI